MDNSERKNQGGSEEIKLTIPTQPGENQDKVKKSAHNRNHEEIKLDLSGFSRNAKGSEKDAAGAKQRPSEIKLTISDDRSRKANADKRSQDTDIERILRETYRPETPEKKDVSELDHLAIPHKAKAQSTEAADNDWLDDGDKEPVEQFSEQKVKHPSEQKVDHLSEQKAEYPSESEDHPKRRKSHETVRPYETMTPGHEAHAESRSDSQVSAQDLVSAKRSVSDRDRSPRREENPAGKERTERQYQTDSYEKSSREDRAERSDGAVRDYQTAQYDPASYHRSVRDYQSNRYDEEDPDDWLGESEKPAEKKRDKKAEKASKKAEKEAKKAEKEAQKAEKAEKKREKEQLAKESKAAKKNRNAKSNKADKAVRNDRPDRYDSLSKDRSDRYDSLPPDEDYDKPGKSGKNKKKKKRKGSLTTIILVILILLGVGVMLYPSFSDWYNSLHQSRAIAEYDEIVRNNSDETNEKLWEEAVAYNEEIAQKGVNFNLTDDKAEKEKYDKVLDVSGTGIMGYIKIPEVNINLPIYHDTTEGVLQIAVGHLAGTSLPVGGDSSHCVLTGHTGLPSARLFTDIDQMVIGDTFQIVVLDHTLTYEVDDIQTVLPNELSSLNIQEGKDLVTLVTCTPYGINTHRLLVTGHRIANPDEAGNDTIGAGAGTRISMKQVVPFLVLAAAGLFIILFPLFRRKKKHS